MNAVVGRKPLSELEVVFWPDTHIVSHHRDAVYRLISFIQAKQPGQVVLLGDFLDGHAIGRWTADTADENGKSLQAEVSKGREILADLRSAYDGPVSWLRGNHELRLQKWGTRKGRAVFGLDCLTIPALLGFSDLGITSPGGGYTSDYPFEVLPGVVAIHGDKLGTRAGTSVHKEMEFFGLEKSVVMGHTHRLAIVYRAGFKRSVFGVESGHLMDQRKADYISYGTADWQMGFSVIERQGKHLVPRVVPMAANGSFYYGGEVW